MTQFVDRRLNGRNKSAVNRQRFIHRFRSQIKKAVSDAISNRSIKEIDQGEKITIPAKDISEPHFAHGAGGSRQIIHPGNRDFITGDKISRPPSDPHQGSGQGEGNETPSGEDPFAFEISKEEFLDLFFEDLELPHLIKTKINQIESYKMVRAGFTPDGIHANLNILRSFRSAIGRKKSMKGAYDEKIEKLQEALEAEKNPDAKSSILEEIKNIENKKSSIPFIDNIDLRFNNRIKILNPATQAVMFCIMDVSGSMDEPKKEIAKRFFILLYLFLNRAYKKIDLIFIRHHTSAKEVNENDFFYSRETGGTVVSSALDLMCQIMADRYPPQDWNIYAAQASDGDNWNNDSPKCKEILIEKIMPCLQYFAYVEIMPRHHQSLWECYEEVKQSFNHFAMESISDFTDIYHVFRELFKKQ